jgi:hypothetical protein
MHLQLLHNTDSLPWSHWRRRLSGYQAPPVVIQPGAQPQAMQAEDGSIVLDENGNAIFLE